MRSDNPAEFVAEWLKATRDGKKLSESGEWIEGRRARDLISAAVGLTGAGALEIARTITATSNTLDYLFKKAETFSDKKRLRYQKACVKILTRLDGELNQAEEEIPEELDFNALISEFEHFAIELEDRGEYLSVPIADIEELLTMLEELDVAVNVLPSDHTFKWLFSDVISQLRQAVLDLNRFGPVASQERLKDALGRLGTAKIVARTKDENNLLESAWALFGKILPYVDQVGKLKALPDLYHALMGHSDKSN